MRRTALATGLAILLCMPGCAKSEVQPTGPAPLPATPSSTGSPSPTPVYVPKLPTTMSDDGGNCVSAGRCGYYVAGPTCKGIEWCKKEDLVEPGLWSTDGGDGFSDCMWGLSVPPTYDLDDGGYAEERQSVMVPKGAIFDTHDCANDWAWQQP
jgi:hypothetical protein